MIVHNFDPVFIDLGIFQIKWYSLAYIFGILLGWVYAIKIIKIITNKHKLTLVTSKNFDDLLIYLIFGIIIGGRLGYVFFYNLEYYIQNLSEIFKLWNGGMSFHGGLLGVIIATIVVSTFIDAQNNYLRDSLIVITTGFFMAVFSISSWCLIGKYLRNFATSENFIKKFNYIMSFLLIVCVIMFYV